jgi:plastocyanin
MTRRLFPLVLAVLVLALGAAACGGDDDDDGAAEEPVPEEPTTDTGAPAGGGSSITLTADPGGALAFDTTELTAAAGDVTIELVNDSGIQHNVEVEGNGVDELSDTITEGSTELSIQLDPGEYTFFCAVPGHQAAGMEGTLTVE